MFGLAPTELAVIVVYLVACIALHSVAQSYMEGNGVPLQKSIGARTPS